MSESFSTASGLNVCIVSEGSYEHHCYCKVVKWHGIGEVRPTGTLMQLSCTSGTPGQLKAAGVPQP